MKTSTLRAFKAHVSLWKFFAALLLAWICVPMSQASALTSGTLKAYLEIQQTRRNTWPAELVLRSQRYGRQRNHRLG